MYIRWDQNVTRVKFHSANTADSDSTDSYFRLIFRLNIHPPWPPPTKFSRVDNNFTPSFPFLSSLWSLSEKLISYSHLDICTYDSNRCLFCEAQRMGKRQARQGRIRSGAGWKPLKCGAGHDVQGKWSSSGKKWEKRSSWKKLRILEGKRGIKLDSSGRGFGACAP